MLTPVPLLMTRPPLPPRSANTTATNAARRPSLGIASSAAGHHSGIPRQGQAPRCPGHVEDCSWHTPGQSGRHLYSPRPCPARHSPAAHPECIAPPLLLANFKPFSVMGGAGRGRQRPTPPPVTFRKEPLLETLMTLFLPTLSHGTVGRSPWMHVLGLIV